MASSYDVMLRVRGVLAAIAIGGALSTFVHCGSLDSATASGFDGDAGGGDDASLGPDGGRDASADGGGAPTVLVVVHASPDLYDFRVCFGASTSADGLGATFDPNAIPWPYDDAHPMASSNYAGIAVGGGATLPREITTDGRYVVPYLIDAHQLAMSSSPTAKCNTRVGPQCVPNSGLCLKTSDFVQLPAIPSSMIEGGGTRVLAIVGCKTPGAAACGTELSGVLHAATLPLTTASIMSVDQMSVQVAHVAVAAGPVVATLDPALSDAGAIPLSPLGVGPKNGAIANVPQTPGSLDWGSQGVSIRMAQDAGLRMSLADLQRVSDPSVLPSDFFKARGSYVFVLIGDTSATNALFVDGGLNPKFDGTALHFVAISTEPSALPDGG